MRIYPDKEYTLLEVQKLTGIKSRQYLSRYINEGKLLAIQSGTGTQRRYKILGSWVQDFMKRYKRGETDRSYTKEEIKKILKV